MSGLKRIAACLILFSWLLALFISSAAVFGAKGVLAGGGMAVLIVAVVWATVWAFDTLYDKYPTHYGADPPY